MNKRFVYLTEKFFDNDLSESEKQEFESLLKNNKTFLVEFEEQKRIKEVMSKMRMRNPGRELWDGYWESIYNRVERGIAWLAIAIGGLILLGFAAFRAAEAFMNETELPVLVKAGILILLFGFLVLIVSLIRERYFVHKKDKYKEIQR
ncbi:MAG: hypothetical protein Kow0098_05100 [Ignavibacteriaceae bacterium]